MLRHRYFSSKKAKIEEQSMPGKDLTSWHALDLGLGVSQVRECGKHLSWVITLAGNHVVQTWGSGKLGKVVPTVG